MSAGPPRKGSDPQGIRLNSSTSSFPSPLASAGSRSRAILQRPRRQVRNPRRHQSRSRRPVPKLPLRPLPRRRLLRRAHRRVSLRRQQSGSASRRRVARRRVQRPLEPSLLQAAAGESSSAPSRKRATLGHSTRSCPRTLHLQDDSPYMSLQEQSRGSSSVRSRAGRRPTQPAGNWLSPALQSLRNN
jgi:hypothetical protein